MANKLISPTEAARILGIGPVRVRVLITEGRLPAQKIGRVWVIKESDLEKVRDRPNGRPPKS